MINLIFIIFFAILLQHEKVESVKNYCDQCKVLTDSFNYWLGKTSRGKFEGGDAAWEAAKLKSYARSEVRLAEIQESLCSELKKERDQCYALNEDVEQVLESWWALENSTVVDLYTWLCIEQLKYCCPIYHYGELCLPCPSKNNKMCNGHGECSGEGTREGNGTCICVSGYKGTNCDKCDDNFYEAGMDICLPCHISCNGCNNEGPTACLECAKGWVLQSGVCNDVNECQNPSVCKRNSFCVNKEGSYSCVKCHKTCRSCENAGHSNCTSCDPEKVLLAGQCVTKEQVQETLFGVLLKIFIYLVLIFINVIIFRKSKPLATLVVIGISIFIYFIEKSYEINSKHIILNYSKDFLLGK